MQKTTANAADQSALAVGELLALAQAQIGTRFFLKHEGKVFRTHAGLQIAHHIFHAHQLLGHQRGQLVLGWRVDRGWIDTFVVHGGRSAKALSHRSAKLLQALLDKILHIGLEGANRAQQCGIARHHTHGGHIARPHGAQADYHVVHRLDVARNNTLDRRDDVRCHQDRINSQVGMRTMAALAGDLDGDAVGRCHHRPRINADAARRHSRPVVHGVN